MARWHRLVPSVLTMMLVLPALGVDVPPPPPESPYPELGKIGKRFRFAMIADPQVSHADTTGRVALNARKTLEQAVTELNAIADPPVAFTVYLGDMVNVPDKPSWDNFVSGMKHDKSQVVLVHGNHDTRWPYTGFRRVQKAINGFEAMYYSFDVGDWHFVVLPDNLFSASPAADKWEKGMLDWLEKDLAENADRPTMVFHHRHILPGGLSQLEFYTHRLALRLKLRELYTRHGNVKYHFNGHVHNGVQASVKMARQFAGIQMLTIPTIIASRPFGEEFPEFSAGTERGGYYVVVDVDGEDVTLTARLADSNAKYTYAESFPEFDPELEPRWWTRLPDLKAHARMVNGSFESRMAGWLQTFRYLTDKEPGYKIEVDGRAAEDGHRSLYVMTREKGQDWAVDEYSEAYQVVSLVECPRPLLEADYRIEERPTAGGGWVRAAVMGDGDLKALFMFRWSTDNAERKADYVARCFGTMIRGRESSWLYYQQLGDKKKGLYFDLPQAPGTWHHLTANLAQLYDEAIGRSGAFEKLRGEKVLVGLGTYCVNSVKGAHSAARFDGIRLANASSQAISMVDDSKLVVADSVFKCRFGQALEERLVGQRAKRAKARRNIRPGENLVFNGDAEGGVNPGGAPVGWFHAVDGWALDQNDGNHVFHVTGIAGRQTDFRSESVTTAVTPGTLYNVQWRWRYDVKQGRPSFKVRWFDKNGEYLAQFSIPATGTQSAWKQAGWQIAAPPDAASFDVRVLFDRDDTGEIWFDDVVVSEVTK